MVCTDWDATKSRRPRHSARAARRWFVSRAEKDIAAAFRNMTWKPAAVGRFQNGDTVRTEGFRCTEYTDGKGRAVASMRFDQMADPKEEVNVVNHSQQVNVAQSLADKLHEQMERNSD